MNDGKYSEKSIFNQIDEILFHKNQISLIYEKHSLEAIEELNENSYSYKRAFKLLVIAAMVRDF